MTFLGTLHDFLQGFFCLLGLDWNPVPWKGFAETLEWSNFLLYPEKEPLLVQVMGAWND